MLEASSRGVLKEGSERKPAQRSFFALVDFSNPSNYQSVKTKKVICLALIGSVVASEGFSLDFTGLSGSIINDKPFSIPVEGYGTIEFTVPDSFPSASIGSSFSVPALELAPNGAVLLTFVGGEVSDFSSSQMVATNPGISFSADSSYGPNQVLLSSSYFGKDDPPVAVGVHSISFNAVPEPSSIGLLMMGLCTAVARRRR